MTCSFSSSTRSTSTRPSRLRATSRPPLSVTSHAPTGTASRNPGPHASCPDTIFRSSGETSASASRCGVPPSSRVVASTIRGPAMSCRIAARNWAGSGCWDTNNADRMVFTPGCTSPSTHR